MNIIHNEVYYDKSTDPEVLKKCEGSHCGHFNLNGNSKVKHYHCEYQSDVPNMEHTKEQIKKIQEQIDKNGSAKVWFKNPIGCMCVNNVCFVWCDIDSVVFNQTLEIVCRCVCCKTLMRTRNIVRGVEFLLDTDMKDYNFVLH